MSAPAGWLRRSLGAKLLLAQMLVVVAGSLTIAVIALAVAPGVFHTHVRMALGTIPPEVTRHLDEGLARAMLVALGTGTGVAVATALGVSLLLARRIAGPLGALSRAAGQLARGRYSARVPKPAGDDELASLAAAFNTMAETLAASEQRRRPKPPGCAGWSTTSTPSPAPKRASSTCTWSAASPTRCSPPPSRPPGPPMPPRTSP